MNSLKPSVHSTSILSKKTTGKMTIKIGSSTSNKYEPEIVNEIIEKMQKSS